MNDIIDRLLLLFELEDIKMPWLESQTGVKVDRWHTIKKGKVMRTTELESIYHVYPEYKVWLATGMEMPEHGQVSPMTKRTQKDLNRQVTGSE